MIYISIGAFFGAISRHFIDLQMKKHVKEGFPLGTLTVNLLGAFLIGLVYNFVQLENLQALLAIGFLGAFTTFSTFTMDLIVLYEKKQFTSLSLYLFITLIGGIFFSFIGYIL